MKHYSRMTSTNSSCARTTTRDTHSQIYSTLQASSSTSSAFKPQVLRCKPPGPSFSKFQAAGFGAQAAFSHRFHAAGSVGSAGQAPNSRFRIQSSRFYLFPQILSPQYSDSRPEPQPRPQPHVPCLRFQAQPPTSPKLQFHKPQVPAPDQRLQL